MLGCSQRSLRAAAERRLQGRCELVVRESGGGAVLTGPWLVSASVVLPPGHAWLGEGLLEGYRRLGQLHVTALQALDIPARSVPPQELHASRPDKIVTPVAWACFGSLSPWEVVSLQGRKLVGLAQRRRPGGVLLVAGTLVGDVDWPLLCEAMGQPQDAAALSQATVSCQALAPDSMSVQRFVAHLTQGLAASLA